MSSDLLGADESDAAAGDDAFFHGRAGRVEGVFDAGLLFLHLGLGRGADIDDGDAAGELGEALLELLAVVVAGGFLDLAADLARRGPGCRTFLPSPSMIVVFSLSIDDALGAAEVFERDVLELDAEVFAEETAAGEDGDVFEHGLAAIAEARGLDGADLEGAAELVHDEGREGFAFDVFGDDEQRPAGLGDLLEQRAAGP